MSEPGRDGAAPLAVELYESNWCGYCRAARRLLEGKGWPIDAHLVDGQPELRARMTERAGRTSVPQIWIGDTHVGGYDDLAELEQDGELDALYARESG